MHGVLVGLLGATNECYWSPTPLYHQAVTSSKAQELVGIDHRKVQEDASAVRQSVDLLEVEMKLIKERAVGAVGTVGAVGAVLNSLVDPG